MNKNKNKREGERIFQILLLYDIHFIIRKAVKTEKFR